MTKSPDKPPFATLMADIHRMFSTALYRQLKSDGIELTRSQWRVIVHLRAQNGLTQSELAERLLIEKAPAGTLIDKLEARGLVERRPDPNDRRAKRVYATPACDPLVPVMEQVVQDLKNQCMDGLTQAEQEMLHQLLSKVHGNLQEVRQQNSAQSTPPVSLEVDV